MAWIYLAVSEELPKPSKDTSPLSLTVKTTDMLKPYCCPSCKKVYWSEHQYGTTCELFKGKCCLQLTSSTAGSPVRIFPTLAAKKAWTESEAVYSLRSLGLSASYDLLSCSWRTFQRLLFEEQSELLENFASCGMTVGGGFYPLQMWERTTKEKDGSFWRTPQARDWKGPQGRAYKGIALDLPSQVQNWPTLAASQAHKKIRPLAPSEAKGTHGQMTVGAMGERYPETIGGYLNPTWVEWLMGYPSEWTVLEDWAMQWYRPKRGKHLKD